MKLKKIGYNDILDYSGFMAKYRKKINGLKISKNTLSDMRAMLADYDDVLKNRFKFYIMNILIAIAEVKYMDCPRPDIGSVFRLVRSVNSINTYKDLYSDEYFNWKELYDETYDYLCTSGYYSEYFIGRKDEIDYSYEKLLDIKYHLNNFKQYCNMDDPYNKDFINVINSDLLWRCSV